MSVRSLPGPVSSVRHGLVYWWRGYVTTLRLDLVGLRTFLVLVVVIQLLMSAGMAVIYGFYLGGDMPATAALYIVTGAPTLALIPVGMVFVPNTVFQKKLQGSYDFEWTLPVPRSATVMAAFSVFTATALPGAAVALAAAGWRYGLELSISVAIVPAILLVGLVSTSVGYGFAHAIANPRVANLLVNLIVFFVLLFSPIAFPIDNFPAWFAGVHHFLPFHSMAQVVRAGLTDGIVADVMTSYLTLGVWGLGAWAVTGWVLGRRG